MRVSVLRGTKDLVVEERPEPVPGPHEVLVRVSSVGVCGSDVHYYEHGRIGSYVVDQPLVLGHEAAGEVVGLGESVTRLRVGQRVSVEPGVPDFSCRQCLAGRYNLCEGMQFYATPPVDGAFAELVTVHEQFAHPVPDTLTDDAAALLEPLSVGLWACRKAAVGPGTRVLVTGAGPVGLVAAQAALALGAASVAVTDVNPHRLALALDLGVTESVDVSETPVSRIQERELTVTGTFRYAHTWPGAIALAASGRVRLDRLVTGHYGLDQVADALSATRTDPHAVKPMVVPGR
jgi:L-iditol 2-dehydrogenase